MVVALVGVAVVVSSGDDEGVSHPDDWDPRVVELVDFVQDERGLLYEHPVDDRLPHCGGVHGPNPGAR